MERGTLGTLVDCLSAVVDGLPQRTEYPASKYSNRGDDLYANKPFCEKLIEHGISFIFTCKEESHPRLYETLRNSYTHEVKETKWDARKKKYIHYTWQYLNDVPVRYDEKEPFLVNYMSFEMRTGAAEDRKRT